MSKTCLHFFFWYFSKTGKRAESRNCAVLNLRYFVFLSPCSGTTLIPFYLVLTICPVALNHDYCIPAVPTLVILFAVLWCCSDCACYVVGSRQLMPPDALQPKAYCTNTGLQSFLLALPGVSTRDPSSERRNYLGEKWLVISTESCDFHFRVFYMPQICDMGQTALLPFRRKACWGFFRPEKSDGFGRV